MSEVLDHLPLGILLVDHGGRLLTANSEASALLGPALMRRSSPPRCCDLFNCRATNGPVQDRCLTELALENGVGLPEIRIDLGSDGPSSVWVSAAPAPWGAIFNLRRGMHGDRRRRTEPHWIAGPLLNIRTLGPTSVTSGDSSLDGSWLEHRTGRLLKLLVTERGRVMHAEQIAAALWPNAGLEGLGNLRQCVHALRDKLEPRRAKHGPSSFVLARNGGYQLDSTRVRIDADEFDARAAAGLVASDAGDASAAVQSLNSALKLYGGDFLADEPYADWAFAERDRLRDLAGQALRTLSDIHLRSGEFEAAAGHLTRLAQADPFDVDVQRQLIGLYLGAGRRSQAVRRYNRLRQQMLKEFGERLNFELSDLSPEARGEVGIAAQGTPDIPRQATDPGR